MDSTLQEGITAAKSGDKTRAFQLLVHAARNQATAEQAWLWLSSVVEADSEKLYCLNYALKINPNNVAAQRGVATLTQKGILPAVPVYPEAAKSPAPAATSPRPTSTPRTPPFNLVPPASAQAAPSSSIVAPVAATRMESQPVSAGISQPQAASASSVAPKPQVNKQEATGLYRYAAGQLAKNSPPQVVEKLLVSQGTSPELANKIVIQTSQALKKARRDKSKKRMLWGSVWIAGGVIVTVVTYAFADQLGGSFYIFYGAIIFGLIDFFIGLGGWLSER